VGLKHLIPDRVKPSDTLSRPGTLTLMTDRQSARMSKIINDLTRSGMRCFTAVPIWQQMALKGFGRISKLDVILPKISVAPRWDKTIRPRPVVSASVSYRRQSVASVSRRIDKYQRISIKEWMDGGPRTVVEHMQWRQTKRTDR